MKEDNEKKNILHVYDTSLTLDGIIVYYYFLRLL
jgi:hypothetical protein